MCFLSSPFFPSPVQSRSSTIFTREADPGALPATGVNDQHLNLTLIPERSTTTIAKGDRIRFDYRGDLKLAPNALLIVGASDETETFRQDALNKSSNLRGQFVELQTDYQKTFFLVANGRIDDDEFFGSHATYRVAPAVIVPWTDTKFRASYGTGFKVPTLSQRFQDFPQFNFFGNPNLKPESSTGYDIGFEQPLWDKRALVGATYFNNDLTDLIQARHHHKHQHRSRQRRGILAVNVTKGSSCAPTTRSPGRLIPTPGLS
jgi:vitamin B12 transporter